MNETSFFFVCVCCRSIWFFRMWKIILCLSVICLTTLTNGNYASHEFTEDVMFCETCQLQQGAKFMVLQLSEMTRFWQWRTNGRTWLPFVGLCTVNDNHRVHFWYLLFWKKSWILDPKICTKPVCTIQRCHRIKTKLCPSHPSFNQRIQSLC